MDTYTPDQAAALIGASTSTVRNWCKSFATKLSPGANPPLGTERRLLQSDVATLQQVRNWRSAGKSVAQIHALIEAAQMQGEEPQFTIDVASRAAPTAQIEPESTILLPVALSAMQSQIDALAREIATVDQRQGQRINSFVSGAIVGAGIALIVVALALTFAR